MLTSKKNQKESAIATDWILYLKIEVNDYAHAIRIERKIKSMKSSQYIMNLKRYPEMIEKLIKETKKSN